MSQKTKIRNAMWELWEDRVVALRQERDDLAARVDRLLEANNRELERRRKAERERTEALLLVDELLTERKRRLTSHLSESKIDGTTEPRCDVPDFRPAIAQHRGGTNASS